MTTKPVHMDKLKGLDNEVAFASDTMRIMLTNRFKVPEKVSIAAWNACNDIGLETFKNVYRDMCAALDTNPENVDGKFAMPDNSERFIVQMNKVVLHVTAATTNDYFYDNRESHRGTAISQLEIATAELAHFIQWAMKVY